MVTVDMIWSICLLAAALPLHKESRQDLVRSGIGGLKAPDELAALGVEGTFRPPNFPAASDDTLVRK